MTLREEYEMLYKPVKIDANAPLHYIMYLELRLGSVLVILDEVENVIKEREQAAWDAARDNMKDEVGDMSEELKFRSIEEWRNSK